MGKKITEHKGVNILLAVLIAVVFWVYVTTVVSPNNTRVERDVPVTLLGEDVLNGKGLMIDPSTDLSMDLTLTGNWSAIWKAAGAATDMAVTADVTNISSAGEHTLPCKISGGMTVENSSSRTIKVNVIKMLSKTVEVRGSFTGSVPEGYRTNDFAINPSTIVIQGPESIVNQVEYAQVTVSGAELTKTYTNDLGFEYIAAEGKKVSGVQITSNAETVNVILPVVKTLEVPLTVEFTYGGGATAENVEYTISPATIQISGDETDVTPLQDKSISLGVIDLSKVVDTGTLSFPIGLSPTLTNDSGVSEAQVTVTISGLETKTFVTGNIEPINAPEEYTATPVTQSLQVRVRGTGVALDEIYDSQLRVVVDLKDQALSPGQFRLPAKVYLDVGGQVGVVGEYFVVVSIS